LTLPGPGSKIAAGAVSRSKSTAVPEISGMDTIPGIGVPTNDGLDHRRRFEIICRDYLIQSR